MQVEAVTKTVYDDVWDWRMENDNKPIWTRNPKDVSDEAYNEFFKQTFSEFLDPLAHLHFNVEVRVRCAAHLMSVCMCARFIGHRPKQAMTALQHRGECALKCKAPHECM